MSMLNFGIDCIANERQRRRCIFNAKQKKWRENSTSSDYKKDVLSPTSTIQAQLCM